MQLISRTANNNKWKYRFNKDFTTWHPLATRLIVSPAANGVSPTANESLAPRLPTKERKKIYTKERGGTFVPPTLQEVLDYCTERKNVIDAEQFIDFYSSKGWFIGKNKMKDWRAAVRTWEKRDGRRRVPVIDDDKQ